MRSQAAHTALIPSQQIEDLILVVILCAEGKQKAHTSDFLCGEGKQAPHTPRGAFAFFPCMRKKAVHRKAHRGVCGAWLRIG